jgi:SAM-dependent methyltransferase
MEKQEYFMMFKTENEHWWYKSLRRNIFVTTRPYIQQNKRGYLPQTNLILDAGCGTGANLVEFGQNGYAVGLDFAPEALSFCKQRGLSRLLRGSVMVLPLKSDRFDIIYSIDVLYHRWVTDDVLAMKEYHRVLKPGGLLVLNIPCFNFLTSTHDEAIYTARRYREKEIILKLHNAGFVIERIICWNTILFPIITVIRLIKKWLRFSAAVKKSDIRPVMPILNAVLYAILSLETFWLSFANLPFGLSILCIAKKSIKKDAQ